MNPYLICDRLSRAYCRSDPCRGCWLPPEKNEKDYFLLGHEVLMWFLRTSQLNSKPSFAINKCRNITAKKVQLCKSTKISWFKQETQLDNSCWRHRVSQCANVYSNFKQILSEMWYMIHVASIVTSISYWWNHSVETDSELISTICAHNLT